MIKKLLAGFLVVVFFPLNGIVAELPDSANLPRMPDEYRAKNQRKVDPVGMWFYDVAEEEAEKDYFDVEVVPLEESRKILKKRKEDEQKKLLLKK